MEEEGLGGLEIADQEEGLSGSEPGFRDGGGGFEGEGGRLVD